MHPLLIHRPGDPGRAPGTVVRCAAVLVSLVLFSLAPEMLAAAPEAPGPTDVALAIALSPAPAPSPDGEWQVTFRFAEPQSALVFRQAGVPYRADDWTSLTPGAEVAQLGQIDALLFDAPAREASFRFVPQTQSLRKAYTPFLAFADGSWGVLTGQFRISAAASRQAIASLQGNADDWPDELLSSRVVLRAGRTIWIGGESYEE